MEKKIIVGVGVPGCGKTTFLKPLARKLGLAYINPDSIRKELTGDASDHSKDVDVWKKVHQHVKGALDGKGAVIDATYTKRKSRVALVKFCKLKGTKEIVAYWFRVPLNICVARNSKRPRKVPIEVIEKMHNRLKLNPPTLDERFTKIVSIRQ